MIWYSSLLENLSRLSPNPFPKATLCFQNWETKYLKENNRLRNAIRETQGHMYKITSLPVLCFNVFPVNF